MPDTETSRHSLPYLTVSQASKEITHNEAVFLIDALLHPVVEGQLALPPVLLSTEAGKCWIVSSGASADWQGKDDNIALWTGGSWRFQAASDGMTVRNRQSGMDLVWSGTNWIEAPNISDPQFGNVIDLEARTAIVELLSFLRVTGQIES